MEYWSSSATAFSEHLERLTQSALRGASASAIEAVALGADVSELAIWQRQLMSTTWSRFRDSRFTEDEIAYCADRPERFAGRWAAKEAVAKAIGTGFRGLRPSHVEIVRSKDGQPSVRSTSDTSWPYHAQSWAWSISISHDGGYAAAVALALRGKEREK